MGRPPREIANATPIEAAKLYLDRQTAGSSSAKYNISFQTLLKHKHVCETLQGFVEDELHEVYGERVQFRSLRDFKEWCLLPVDEPNSYGAPDRDQRFLNSQELVARALAPERGRLSPAIYVRGLDRAVVVGSWGIYLQVVAYGLRTMFHDSGRFTIDPGDGRVESEVHAVRHNWGDIIESLRRKDRRSDRDRLVRALESAGGVYSDIIEALTEPEKLTEDGSTFASSRHHEAGEWMDLFYELLPETRTLRTTSLESKADRGRRFLRARPHAALEFLHPYRHGQPYVEGWALRPGSNERSYVFTRPAIKEDFDVLRYLGFPDRGNSAR